MDPKTTNSLIIELLQHEEGVEDGLDALEHFLRELGVFNQANSTEVLFSQNFPAHVFSFLFFFLTSLFCLFLERSTYLASFVYI